MLDYKTINKIVRDVTVLNKRFRYFKVFVIGLTKVAVLNLNNTTLKNIYILIRKER